MKARDGHKLGMFLCLQLIGITVCVMLIYLFTGKIPVVYWFFLTIFGIAEAYNLARLNGKYANDEW